MFFGGFMYQLEMMDKSGKLVIFPLPDRNTTLTIGRRSDHDVVLADLSVSRNHALIVRKQGRILIEDLDSANGVIVNSRRIYEATEIFPGDEVMIGENRLFLRERTREDESSG